MATVTNDRPVQISSEGVKATPKSSLPSDYKTKRVVEKRFQCLECKRWFANEANILKGHFLCATNMQIRRGAMQANMQGVEMPKPGVDFYLEPQSSPPVKVLSSNSE